MDRSRMYKNKDKDGNELRRRRQDESVELRKAKKDDSLLKRRNIAAIDSENEEELNALVPPLGQAPKAPLDNAEQCVNQLLHLAQSGASDITAVKECIEKCRAVLSRPRNPPLDVFVSRGTVPVLLSLLNEVVPSDIQFEATWALTNIASGTSEQTKAIVDANGVEAFIRLLDSTDFKLAEQAVWALSNIVGDSHEFRNLAIDKGIVEPLIGLLARSKDQPTVVAYISWLMSNLCRAKDRSYPPTWVLERILPFIVNIALKKGYASNHDARVDAYWALTYAADCGQDDILELIMKTGVIRHMVDLCSLNEEERILNAALRCIGNVVTGSDDLTDRVLKYGLLSKLVSILKHKKSAIVKETCWIISNITAGTKSQIDLVVKANIIPILLKLMKEGDVKTQREALWAVSNMVASGSPEHIQYALNMKTLSVCAHHLRDSQPKILTVCMELIHNLLTYANNGGSLEKYAVEFESAEGLDALEQLQEHPNSDVYQQAFSLIEQFFSTEEEQTAGGATTEESISFQQTNPGPTFSF